MKRRASLCVVIVILTGACLAVAHPGRAEDTDQVAVAKAAAHFYAALNAMFTGDVAPMTAVWSHADDVTYMGPGGGFDVGWQKVRANWAAQAAKKLGGEVK